MVTIVTIFYIMLIARDIFLARSFLTPRPCSVCRDRRSLQNAFVVCKNFTQRRKKAIWKRYLKCRLTKHDEKSGFYNESVTLQID